MMRSMNSTEVLNHRDAPTLPRNAKTGEVCKYVKNLRIETKGFLAYDQRVSPGPRGLTRMVCVQGTWCELDSPYYLNS